MRSVVIIEDKRDDFEEISKVFIEASWRVLPTDYSVVAGLFETDAAQELLSFFRDLILSNYVSIGGVVLDISLLGGERDDEFGLEGMLSMIRTLQISDPDYSLWSRQVPIIAYSHIHDYQTKKQALTGKYHVHTFVSKDSLATSRTKEVRLTAEALYSIFETNLSIGGFNTNLKELFDSFVTLMLSEMEAIRIDLNDQIHIIRGNLEQADQQLRLLLIASLKGLPKSELANFVKQFEVELLSSTTEEEYKVITESLSKNGFFADLGELIKDGSVSELMDFVEKALSAAVESNLLTGIPLAPLIAAGLSTVLKLLGKALPH